MTVFVINIILGCIWVGLTGDISVSAFFTGFIVGYFLLLAIYSRRSETTYFNKILDFTGFIVFYFMELVLSNFRIALEVLAFKQEMHPGVIAIDLDVKTDAQITLLANLITMTPGTFILDLSQDRKKLFIHAMYVYDPRKLEKEIKDSLEQKIINLFK